MSITELPPPRGSFLFLFSFFPPKVGSEKQLKNFSHLKQEIKMRENFSAP